MVKRTYNANEKTQSTFAQEDPQVCLPPIRKHGTSRSEYNDYLHPH